MKDLIKISDWSRENILTVLGMAKELKEKRMAHEEYRLLEGKTLGMIFAKSSTRTRVSFEVGMYQLGGNALYMNVSDIQMGRGESIYDTANVLSGYLDGVMIRTFSQQDVADFASNASIPVINGLTDEHHPCQALADIFTILELKGTLEGIKVAYVGDGNNVAHSLMEICAKLGVDFSIATPSLYQCNESIVQGAKTIAAANSCNIDYGDNPQKAVEFADVVYTDTWVSMGCEEEKEQRLHTFIPYQVNEELMSLANSDAVFMHSLPAYRGFEVTEDVIDGPNSFVFQQSENRLHVQKAIMVFLMGDM